MTGSDGTSDSDSDFGDFEGVAVENTEISSPIVSLEDQLNLVFGPHQTISYSDEKHDLNELICEERPKVIYEQLVALEPHLRPFQWRHSKLRSKLLHTLQIEDIPETPKVVKKLDPSLYERLASLLEDNQAKDDTAIIADLLGAKLSVSVADDIHDSTTQPTIAELRSIDIDSLDTHSLNNAHNQLIDAILTVCQEIRENDINRERLIEEKGTFEDLLTNLIGHTQRLHRDEIAEFNRKKKSGSKYGRKFKWVR
ncbi:LAFA_0D10880g1_1 [Lachancea sp. 'fantastica']|nr:LAFA_0D10880g1_1 [Lachancea sp. 'fantastica']